MGIALLSRLAYSQFTRTEQTKPCESRVFVFGLGVLTRRNSIEIYPIIEIGAKIFNFSTKFQKRRANPSVAPLSTFWPRRDKIELFIGVIV